MSEPTILIMLRSSKVLGRSEAIDCALIATSVRRPWAWAKSSLQITAAAAPQVGGHAW